MNIQKEKGREVKRINLVVSFMMACFVLFSATIIMAEEGKYVEKKVYIESLVNEAYQLIQAKGEEAISIIKDEKGKFNTKDVYVFLVSGETGADLINPAFPEVEGLPAKDYSDEDEKAAQMTVVNAVKDKDSAWVEYLWPKPGETKPVKKISYLKKIIINGKVRIVGAGFYPE
jgi:signal transduction histidine kinase